MTRNLTILAVFAIATTSVPVLAGLSPEEISQMQAIEEFERIYARAPQAVIQNGVRLWTGATYAGHVRVLTWLKHHQIPGWDVVGPQGFNLWFVAAIEGHVNVLDWLECNKIPGRDALTLGGQTLRAIAETAEQREVVQWLDSNLSPSQVQIVLAAIPVMFAVFSKASKL